MSAAHRRGRRILSLLAAALLLAIGVFVYLWFASGVRPVSTATALQRFKSEVAADSPSSVRSEPPAGVYVFSGSGSERLSVPPKSESEGPGMPGTVIHGPDSCWSLRIDFSDSDWQASTYCRTPQGLQLVARQGWMSWDFVALTIQDTSTYSCTPPERVVPLDAVTGRVMRFTCRGTNHPLDTGEVTMTGTTEVVGAASVLVGGTPAATIHVRERITFSGGQSGFEQTDFWLMPDGLPVRVIWSNEVRTPSPLGTTTMTGSGRYELTSLVART